MQEGIALFLLRLATFCFLLGFWHPNLIPIAFFRSTVNLFPYLGVIKRMHAFISLILRRLRVACRDFFQPGNWISIDV